MEVYKNYNKAEVLDVINKGGHPAVQFVVSVMRPVPVCSEESSVSPAAKADHSDVDCFLLVVLSHGENDHVYARDDKIDIRDITSPFKGDKCKNLVGKPKIFILQVGGNLAQNPTG